VSKVNQTAHLLLTKIDMMAKRKITKPYILKFWNWFFLSHGNKAIDQTPEIELQADLKDCFILLKPIFDAELMALGITAGEKLGSVKVPRIGDIKEALKLVSKL